MGNLKIFEQNSLHSYVDSNREKIDAALVSLRIIKQIDNFLDYNELNQKDLANKLKVSEAFVSQLMSGSKKINVQILNKFEKQFNVEFEFKLRSKNSMYSVVEVVNNTIELRSYRPEFSTTKSFCFSNNSNSVYNLDADYNPIVITK